MRNHMGQVEGWGWGGQSLLLSPPAPASVSTPTHPLCEPCRGIAQVHRQSREGVPGNMCRGAWARATQGQCSQAQSEALEPRLLLPLLPSSGSSPPVTSHPSPPYTHKALTAHLSALPSSSPLLTPVPHLFHPSPPHPSCPHLLQMAS